MSELEIQRRQEYKRRRKRWTIIQIVAIILLIATALSSFLIYNRMNRTQYIEYTETGSIDYKVQYKENEFFPEEWIDKDQSYISSLVNGVTADFFYKIDTGSDEMKFDFKYSINAKLLIASKDKGTPYYTIEEVLVPQKSGKIENRNYLEIRDSVVIDFEKFDDIARSFVDVYGLESNSSCTLIVSLDVTSECMNNGFDDKNSAVYSTALNIPLATDTFNIHRSSLSAEGEVKAFEYTGVTNRDIFFNVGSTSATLAGVILLVLLLFLHVTKNEDITYAAKVRKILRSYGSFIQRMNGEFDCDGYQMININSFVEMLGIRDTIQSPVLMSENRDETMTRFYIPTATKLLYVFEIKVDNYDEIYGTYPEGPEGPDGYEPDEFDLPEEETVETVAVAEVIEVAEATETAEVTEAIEEAPVEETPVEEAPVEETPAEEAPVEETVAEAAETESTTSIPESLLDRIVEVEPSEDGEDGDDVLAYLDESGSLIKITCARSFTANLIQSNPQVKGYYNELKNYILSFKGVKARMSWRNETYKKGRVQLFKMKIRGKTICLYCALDPNDYSEARYFHQTATAKTYASVPMMVRIKSDRGLKRAKELVDAVMAKFFIVPDEKAKEVDYAEEHPYDTTKHLVERGLIKLLFPDAVAAEPPAHHHVHEKKVEIVHDDVVEEIVLFDGDTVSEEIIEEIASEPTPELAEIDFDDASEEIVDFVESEEHPGVDVIGVVWPERPKRNKIYRYDPDGEAVTIGDVVIVPTRDESRDREVIRKAAVAHANHKVPAEDLKHPLKKIVGVLHKKNADSESTKK